MQTFSQAISTRRLKPHAEIARSILVSAIESNARIFSIPDIDRAATILNGGKFES